MMSLQNPEYAILTDCSRHVVITFVFTAAGGSPTNIHSLIQYIVQKSHLSLSFPSTSEKGVYPDIPWTFTYHKL
jgi:hypothetical protein